MDNSNRTFTQNGVTAAEAARSSQALERYLTGMNAKMISLSDTVAPPVSPDTTQQATAPVNGTGEVVGLDGVFLVTLAPAKDPKGKSLYYQVQTSDTVNFDVAGKVISYGGTSGTIQTDWRLHEPNATRFVRWRSRVLNSTFSKWTYYILPSACGPYAVWSGVLRSLATALVSQAMTPTGSNPVSQDGTSTNIKVAPSLWKAGAQKISYNAGNVDPGDYGKYYIYADDPKRQGGTVIFHATQNSDEVTDSDYRVYFGTITTVNTGGAIGVGPGQGCPIGEVEWETPDGGKIATRDLRIGTEVLSIDGGVDRVIKIDSIPDQPCLSIEAENGMVFRGASSSHKLKYNCGPFGSLFELQVGDLMQTRSGPSAITKKIFIGRQTVYWVLLNRTRVGYTDGFASHNGSTK